MSAPASSKESAAGVVIDFATYHALVQLYAEYAYAVDSGDWDLWPGFFVDDCRYRLVPRATLARRRSHHSPKLTPEESSRVARLASVWAFAKDVWGSDEAARRWLFEAHMMLDDRRPVDVVLASEFGRPLVEGILGRLKYGTGL